MRRALPGLALLLAAGCIEFASLPPDADHPGTYGVAVSERDSYLPSFPGSAEETYPVLLAHEHVESPRSGAIVVCFAPGHAPGELPALASAHRRDASYASPAAVAPCEPRADASTGRLFWNATEFHARDPDAVLLEGTAYCYDRVRFFDPGVDQDASVAFQRRDFRVTYEAGAGFWIDDHLLRPGRALKVEYFVQRGDRPDRDRDAKVVALFDHPGTWLKARVGDSGGPLIDPPQAEPPEYVDLPRDAENLPGLLAPLVDRPDWAMAKLLRLEVGWMRGDLFAVAVSAQNTTHLLHAWTYSTQADRIRLELVRAPARTAFAGSNHSFDAIVRAFASSDFDGYLDRAGLDDGYVHAAIHPRLDVEYDWVAEVPERLATAEDAPCGPAGCVWVHAEEPVGGDAWRRIHRPSLAEGGAGVSWVFSGVRDGAGGRVVFHEERLDEAKG